jgi:hypothetical protein
MKHNIKKKLISDKVFLQGVDNPINRIVNEEFYKTNGESFILFKDYPNCRLILDSTTTDHIRIKTLTKLLITPLIGKIDEEYDEIFLDKGACVEFLSLEGVWYIISSDGLKME